MSAIYQANWIINRRTDLIWFIGGVFSAYMLIFMNLGLGWSMVTIWFIWVTLVDTPHFFGTYVRTYLDKMEFRSRKRLLIRSLWVLAVGPIVILTCYSLFLMGFNVYNQVWLLFTSFFGLWAYWHVVRQHYGFLSLYKKKNGETSRLDFRIDAYLLYAGLMLPFFVYVVRSPETNQILVGVADLFQRLTGWKFESFVISLSTGGIVILSAVYIGRQIAIVKANGKFNLPKSLFLLAVLPLHIYIGFSDAILSVGLLGFGAFVTIFHDLQYFAIVWFHQKNRFKKVDNISEYGLSPKISQNLLVFVLSAVFVGVVFRMLGCSLEVHPGCAPFLVSSDIVLFADFAADKLFMGLLLGIAMHHYYLDQFIWKTSKDKQLAKDLKID